MRPALRLAGVGFLFAWAIGVAAFVYPLVGHAVRLRLKQRWSRRLLSVLGVQLQAAWWARSPRGLLVANHVSWLDIFVINAMSPAAFVCKAEVRDWPLVGWLCERTDTVFIERGSPAAARRTKQALAELLREGGLAAVFPEGTTGDGARLLPFRSALFQAAVDAGSMVQPVALSYSDATGRCSAVAAYCGDTTMWQSLCSIAGAARLTVRMEFLAPLKAGGMTRQELMEAAHRLIGDALAQPAIAHQARKPRDYPGEPHVRMPA